MIVLKKCVKERHLQRKFTFIVEREVVAAGDEAEVFQVAAGIEVAFDVAA